MNHPPSFDASIPVLTEVFQDQPARKEPGQAEPAEAQAPSGQDGLNAHLEARAIESWTGSEWTLLERRLSERILQQLQGRVDFVLEQRVRDSLEAALDKAIAGLTDEIRASLQLTIEQIVVRAVSQELAHLQTLKK
jgi:hypothetical protein